MILALIVVLVFVWLKFHPALEITRDKDLLLFYDTAYGRDYVKIMKL